jgi:hypothetical protein
MAFKTRVYGSFIAKTNARVIADTLSGVLGIIARKYSFPWKPEKKIGAISSASAGVARDREKDGVGVRAFG